MKLYKSASLIRLFLCQCALFVARSEEEKNSNNYKDINKHKTHHIYSKT